MTDNNREWQRPCEESIFFMDVNSKSAMCKCIDAKSADIMKSMAAFECSGYADAASQMAITCGDTYYAHKWAGYAHASAAAAHLNAAMDCMQYDAHEESARHAELSVYHNRKCAEHDNARFDKCPPNAPEEYIYDYINGTCTHPMGD